MLALTTATNLVIPQLFRVAVDGITHTIDARTLVHIALTMLLVACAGGYFRVLSRLHMFYAARDIELDIRREFYAHLTKQSPSFFQAHNTGDLMSRATNDLANVRMLFGPGLLNLVNTGIVYATTVPLMAMLSLELTALSLAVYLPALWLVQRLSRRMYHVSRVQQEEMGSLANFVQEHLAGAHVVRAFGLEERAADRFATINDANYRAAIDLAWVRSYVWRLIASFASLGILLAVFFGARDVIHNTLTLGQLVALVEYLALLAWPSFALGWIISLWQRGVAAVHRLHDIVSAEPAERSGTLAASVLEPRVEVSDLTVEREGVVALSGISVTVAAGATLGIVGPIGSGKTTLLDALVRQAPVTRGQIRLGGCELRDLPLATLRAQVAFVHQSPILFSDTVARNVAFGNRNADRETILRALNDAAFAPDLKILPQGLDTEIGERGIMLSGGQKQRLTIARALLLDPPILAIDDALSSVDLETEGHIIASLRRLRRHKTTLIVAHRLSAVQHTDEIIVLDRGSIIERGTHATLVASGGLYAQLYRRQAIEHTLEQTGT